MDIRCFISIELPQEIKKNIEKEIKKLKETPVDIKWVQTDNFHITLKFLGSTPQSLIPEIKTRLTEAVKGQRCFSIEFKGAGVFPTTKYPRVIWIGIRDSDKLVSLQADVEMALSGIGFEPEERRFEPHLTIGRVRSQKAREALIREITNLKDTVFGKIEVKEISIMKSELHPQGPRYERLEEIILSG